MNNSHFILPNLISFEIRIHRYFKIGSACIPSNKICGHFAKSERFNPRQRSFHVFPFHMKRICLSSPHLQFVISISSPHLHFVIPISLAMPFPYQGMYAMTLLEVCGRNKDPAWLERNPGWPIGKKYSSALDRWIKTTTTRYERIH